MILRLHLSPKKKQKQSNIVMRLSGEALTTKLLAQVRAEWARKLKDSGFDDIEYPSGELKKHDRRTQRWDNKEEVISFFERLDEYLNTNQYITPKHRQILQLYTSGIQIKDIVKHTGKSQPTVWRVIHLHTKSFSR